MLSDRGHDGVLSGVRVADFSRVLAGPYATMMLADFGADVIKVEPPGGDETRAWTPPVDARGQSTYFSGVNRGKRSLVLDLNRGEDVAAARRLAREADIVVENFRPGVMARFGLDFDSVRAENPSAIFCSITGFGGGGGAALPGYDLLVQAVGGLMSITGPVEGEPSKVGVALVDVLTGLNAVTGILLALRERERSGTGQRVEVDLMTSLLSALANQASSTLATGRAPARLGNAHPSIAPYELFDASDRPLVIAVGNDRQFAGLVGVLGAPGLAGDPRFTTNQLRVHNRDALRALLAARLEERVASEWVELLSSARVPAGLVNDVAEAFAFAERLGLEPVVELLGAGGDPVRSTANPIHLSATPARPGDPSPELGSAGTGIAWR
ncbi:CaiB/BaiF CoA transferase family protein [Pseudoclavibacter sp. 8L]|uniref:CaiB/BaiF CoA transferase family protein n=1 Tax=Pseudoclavibacter sp. 8L TaxID=2653162 RepID=UPI0012F2F831|nr:CoA transferase [Pseudoclavibacter sp. 8L]VXA99990.1 Acetyl-CoA:oxalate CoA-transferase [Pseudoclavibacter sp. 8L]